MVQLHNLVGQPMERHLRLEHAVRFVIHQETQYIHRKQRNNTLDQATKHGCRVAHRTKSLGKLRQAG